MIRNLSAAILFSLAPIASAGGIFAYKNQNFHADKDATLIMYDSIEPSGPVTWAVSGGKRTRFERSQFHMWLDLDTALPENIADQKDITVVEDRLKEILAFRNRFPKSTEATEDTLKLFSEARSNYYKGTLRYENEWMTAEEFKALIVSKKAAIDTAQMALEKAKADRLRIAELKVEAEATARDKRRFMRIQDLETEIDKLEKTNLEISSGITADFLKMKEVLINSQK